MGCGDSSKYKLVDKLVDKTAKRFAPLDSEHLWPSHYMPIRMFRRADTPLIASKDVKTTFLSSGTTSGPDGRSKSHFSAEGLTVYKVASLRAFACMLEKVLPYQDVGGISLVPPTAIWGDSSLARMIHWIGEFWDVTYANYLDFEDVKAAVARASKNNTRPIFLFGTAFHLIDFLDQNPAIALPEGSCVIETGGTKGRTRSVNRQELYGLIADGFAISQDSIVSEYGMCELASQAYDFVPAGSHIPLAQRSFRFPWWAQAGAMTEPNKLNHSGDGALIIWDRARVDIPAPIQTEDLARLSEDGSFQLLGRIPTAPLKGCSLKVDEVLRSANTSKKIGKKHALNIKKLTTSEMQPMADKVVRLLNDLAKDSIFAERLATEFGSNKLAELSLADFKRGLPKDSETLINAVFRATSGKKEIAEAWLVIPSTTHSFASIHGLALLLACGVRLRLRSNVIVGQGEKSSFDRILELIASHGLEFETLPSSWRLQSPSDIRNECIMVFGDDQTIEAIKQISPYPVAGFGNAFAATWVTSDELSESEIVDKIIQDNISLLQRGCMSARLNIVVGELTAETRDKIYSRFRFYLQDLKPKTLPQQVASSLEIVRLQQLGANVYQDPDKTWLMAVGDKFEDHEIEYVSTQEMCFIFCCFRDHHTAIAFISKFNDLKKIACSERIHLILKKDSPSVLNLLEIVPIGALNAPFMDGMHLKQPILFSDSV